MQPTFWRNGYLKVTFANGFQAYEHLTKVMWVNRTTGKPYFLDYRNLVSEEKGSDGRMLSITLTLPENTVIAKNTDAFVMTDAFPLHKADLGPYHKGFWAIMREWLERK